MPLSGPHAAVLRRVSADLSRAGVRHGIGGSALLALLDLPVTVRDLDIQVAPVQRADVADVLAPHGFSVTNPFATGGPLVRTTRGQLGGDWMITASVDGVPVEIFEHYGVRSAGRWEPLPLRLTGTARIGGGEIPLADPSFWWALYSVLNPAKADLLAPLVPEHERGRAAAELGVPA